MRETADGLHYGRVGPWNDALDHLLFHSNSFSFEMEKDTAGCRALNLNYYCRRYDMRRRLIKNGNLKEDRLLFAQYPSELGYSKKA
jgi:hypothetical protein